MVLSFALLKLFYLLIALLSACAINVLLSKSFPMKWVQDCSPLSFPSDLLSLVLCWGLWSLCSCFVISMDLFAFYTCSHPVWQTSFFEDAAFFFSISDFSLYICRFICGSSIWFYWSICLFLCPIQCFFLILIDL